MKCDDFCTSKRARAGNGVDFSYRAHTRRIVVTASLAILKLMLQRAGSDWPFSVPHDKPSTLLSWSRAPLSCRLNTQASSAKASAGLWGGTPNTNLTHGASCHSKKPRRWGRVRTTVMWRPIPPPAPSAPTSLGTIDITATALCQGYQTRRSPLSFLPTTTGRTFLPRPFLLPSPLLTSLSMTTTDCVLQATSQCCS